MPMRFQFRKKLPEIWAAMNPRLAEGEPAYERGTGKLKIGNGFDRWNDLPYYADGASAGGAGGGGGSGTTVNLRPLFSDTWGLPAWRICGDVAVRDHDDFCILALSITLDAYDMAEGQQNPISFLIPEELCPAKYVQFSGMFTDAQQVRHPAYAALESTGDLTFLHLQDGSFESSLAPNPGQTVAMNFFGTYLRYMPNNEDS